MKIILALALFIGLTCSSPSHSYISTPALLTPTPLSGQPILFSIRVGQCELLDVNNPPYHEAVGNLIRLYAPTRSYIACNIPIRPWELSAGPHAEGAYKVEVYNIYRDITGVAAPPVLLSSHSVIVQGVSNIHHPIPALNAWAALVLILITAVVAFIALRHRKATESVVLSMP